MSTNSPSRPTVWTSALSGGRSRLWRSVSQRRDCEPSSSSEQTDSTSSSSGGRELSDDTLHDFFMLNLICLQLDLLRPDPGFRVVCLPFAPADMKYTEATPPGKGTQADSHLSGQCGGLVMRNSLLQGFLSNCKPGAYGCFRSAHPQRQSHPKYISKVSLFFPVRHSQVRISLFIPGALSPQTQSRDYKYS